MKIVQIATGTQGEEGYLYALTDDGRLFERAILEAHNAPREWYEIALDLDANSRSIEEEMRPSIGRSGR